MNRQVSVRALNQQTSAVLATAAAEVGVLFTTLVLVSGSGRLQGREAAT